MYFIQNFVLYTFDRLLTTFKIQIYSCFQQNITN